MCKVSMASFRDCKNADASNPSITRWSNDMQIFIIERMVISSFITTGFFWTFSVVNMATCGGLIIGLERTNPNEPVLFG